MNMWFWIFSFCVFSFLFFCSALFSLPLRSYNLFFCFFVVVLFVQCIFLSLFFVLYAFSFFFLYLRDICRCYLLLWQVLSMKVFGCCFLVGFSLGSMYLFQLEWCPISYRSRDGVSAVWSQLGDKLSFSGSVWRSVSDQWM